MKLYYVLTSYRLDTDDGCDFELFNSKEDALAKYNAEKKDALNCCKECLMGYGEAIDEEIGTKYEVWESGNYTLNSTKVILGIKEVK